MARIRSDKPEAYQSETLAEVGLAAERTFKGMATIADDRGRLADKPAQINGELWSMRGGHGKDDLEAELKELAAVDLVCRYTGCDGKKYLHLVSWDKHQKIDRPSKSRFPRCPVHRPASAPADYCGLHEGECDHREQAPSARASAPVTSEGTASTREASRDLQHPQTGQGGSTARVASPEPGGPAGPGEALKDLGEPEPPDQEKHPSSRHTREASMLDLGSRTVDLGSRTVEAAREAGRDVTRQQPDAGGLREIPGEGFKPTGALRRWANSAYPGLDLSFETGQFNRHYRSTGARRKSWPDAWQKWIADSHRRMSPGPGRAGPGIPRPSTTDQRVAQAQAVKAQLAEMAAARDD